MMSEHWPRGTLVTRLYEGGSFALSLIRLSGETRAHRSRTTLRFVYVGLRPRSGSAHPAFLTVCRLLYSADLAHHPASSAEFCSAYQTLAHSKNWVNFMRGLVKGGPPRAVIHFLERHSTTLLSAIRSTCDRCPLRSVFELLSPERKRPHGVASLPPQSSGRGFSCSWKRLAPGALPLTGSFLSRFCYFGLK